MKPTRRGFLGLVGGTVAAGAAGFKAVPAVADEVRGRNQPQEPPDFGDLDCRRLWTLETHQPEVRMMIGAGDRDGLRAKISAHYGMLQYLQIFRSSRIVHRLDVEDGSWVKGVETMVPRHLHLINEHLLNSKLGQVRSGSTSEGAESSSLGPPHRMMAGWEQFKEAGMLEGAIPGLLYLRDRLFKVWGPYPYFDYVTGGETENTMEVSIVSEVGLGLRYDGAHRWSPMTIQHLIDATMKDLRAGR
jgi:hypothetical protein